MNVFFIFFLVVSCIAALTLAHHHHHHHHQIPHYHFKYGVHDPHTKDHKTHEEYRDHDNVRGRYTIHDPDGILRIVEYHADKDGFHAVVRREGHGHHPGHHHHHGHGGSSFVGVTHWGHGSG